MLPAHGALLGLLLLLRQHVGDPHLCYRQGAYRSRRCVWRCSCWLRCLTLRSVSSCWQVLALLVSLLCTLHRPGTRVQEAAASGLAPLEALWRLSHTAVQER